MKSTLIPIGLACLCVSLARAQFNPIALAPGSFTQDIVVEKGAPCLANYTTATIDNGTNNNGNTFFEQGYIASLPELGLAPHGTTFTSRVDANHVFRMPPSYVTNNCAFVGANNAPGTSTLQTQVANASLNINDPTAYTGISILYGSGGGGLVNVTVSYADGANEPFSFTSIDWFNTATAAAWIAGGRVTPDGGPTFNTLRTTSQTKLFNSDFTLTHTGSAVTNVAFTYAGTTSYRVFVFAVSATTDGTTFNPVASVSGFNKDAVVEVGAPCCFIQGCNVTMDGGAANNANTFYEQGFATVKSSSSPLNVGNNTSTGTTGLPHPGSNIVSGLYTFTMPASYAGNDCVFIGNYPAGAVSNGSFATPSYLTGTITISSPHPYTALSILGSAGNGPAVIAYTVNYNDSSTQTGSTISVPDWFGGAGQIFTALGRVAVDTPAINNLNVTSAAKLYHMDITLNNTTASATSIALTYSSGGRAALFALSAQNTNTSGTAFSPIAFTGFDADVIVEKEQPFYPAGDFPYTTATMDQGSGNSANTWFERGWVTNGEVSASGLPPAGSTITSLNVLNHSTYRMPPTYTGPNAILIDVNHTNATIPITPTAGTAIALLTAGASIGGAPNVMSNLCILQHANGVNETNLFFGYDWFNTAVAPAFRANGRVVSQYGQLTSFFNNPQQPCLFETIFPLTETVSPVTNIQVRYYVAGSGWTTYVLGVSASTAPVPPIVGPTILSPAATYDGTNFTAQATESGGLPFTNQWQFSADGITWVNLTSGVGNFLNASNVATTFGTVVLTNTGANVTNNGQFRLIVSSPVGTVTNGAATLTIVSPLPDVTQPSDTNSIVLFMPGGEPTAEPAAQTWIHIIDNLVGAAPGKWLTFGPVTAPPWNPSGYAVGFTVTPAIGKTTVSALRFYTGDDHQERDPADYTLEGSNDGGSTWTTIAQGPLNLPAARNAAASAPVNPLTQALQEIRFANNSGYFMYRWSCTNVQNNATANSMQINEIEFLGLQTPTAPYFTLQPVTNVIVWVGSSPTFTVAARGYPTNLSYQWYLNGTNPIAGATSASYTLVNAQLTNSGETFSCTVTNSQGSTLSASSTLTVIAAPTSAYSTNVMHDNPMAYFRLDEGPDDGLGDNGVVAYDRWGGHNGVYTNVTLTQPGYSAFDSDTATLFGLTGGSSYVTAPMESAVEQIPGIDFAAPTNNNVALSVEAWVRQDPSITVQSFDAGIVSKGYGGGGEQFNLDCGGPAHAFRFFVRDVTGNTRASTSSVTPDPGVWHHLVGVFDEANSNVVLYVDGLASPAGTAVPYAGLLSSTRPVSIGARPQTITTNYNLLFYGDIDEVAIYNHALSSNQVLAHFYAAGIAPRFIAQPTNTTVSEGATANFYAPAYGTPALSAQWYQSANGGVTFAPLAGKTAMTLSLPNVPASDDGYQFYLQVTSAYGATNSAVATLHVAFGAPVLQSDVPSSVLAYAGRTFSLQAQFGGTPPITYQWYHNGTPLANGARISGALSNVLTIVNALTNDIGSYQLVAQNIVLGSTTPSGTATVSVETIPDFNTTGLGWTIQQTATGGTRGISGNVLTLTDGTGNEATSAFYNYPLYIGCFAAWFTYQDVGGGGADGVAFVLQNDPRGPAALGGGGGALGLSGITPSAALTFNIYNNNNRGVSFGVNGAQGLPYTTTYPLDLGIGDPIDVTAFYEGGVLSVVLTDSVVHTSFTTNITVNLPALLGTNTAYVGFTGADGGTVSIQTVSDFAFIPLPVLSAQPTSTNTVLLSWPSSIGGYALLQKASVASGGWAASPAVVNLVGGQYQAVVSPLGGAEFYRLVLESVEP